MATRNTALVDVEADRLEVALRRLVAAERLSPAQAEAVRAEFAAAAAARPPRSSVLPEVGGYVGGAFVIAAAIVLAGPRWDEFSRAVQVAILGVPSLLLAGAAAAVALSTPSGWSVRARPETRGRHRLVAVLQVVAGALAAATTIVLAGPDDADRVATTTAAVLAIAGYGFCRSPLGHVVLLGSLSAATASWLIWALRPETMRPESDGTMPAIAVGTAFVVLAVGWALLAGRGVLDERQLGMSAAGVLWFVGAEILATVGGPAGVTAAGYVLLATLAAAGMVGYVRTRYLGVLAVGVIALATVVPQAVIDYTGGALGAGGALLLIGLSIVGASVVGLRLR